MAMASVTLLNVGLAWPMTSVTLLKLVRHGHDFSHFVEVGQAWPMTSVTVEVGQAWPMTSVTLLNVGLAWPMTSVTLLKLVRHGQ